MRVVVDTQPILVTFSRVAIDKIVEFFALEDSVAAEQLLAPLVTHEFGVG